MSNPLCDEHVCAEVLSFLTLADVTSLSFRDLPVLSLFIFLLRWLQLFPLSGPTSSGRP